MRRTHLVLLLAAAGTAAVTLAQDKPPGAPKDGAGSAAGVAAVSGAYAFRTYCASCHGIDGKGDGPLSDSLRFRPPDLTLIAKRNGGDFPAEKVIRIVDGRKPVKGHGGPDMPIWGDAFRNADTAYDDAAAKARIKAVVDHLKTLQAAGK
jgi:mono/diheme cytochrome c family protein